MVQQAEIISLHKYYLNADRMRRDFYNLVEGRSKFNDMSEAIEPLIYLNLWYGCLRVVIEGWNDLGLTDAKVDSLLDNGKIAFLNGVRNDIFHFQKSYIPSRTAKMLHEQDFVSWITAIHSSIGDALLLLLRSYS